jgi:diguanylate cyclase (GGDEF)-like protein
MGSFTRKLVSYFILLSLVPLTAAYWGFESLATRSETRRADARLEAGLRATLGAYADELGNASEAAERLARDAELQQALRRGDARALRDMGHAATSYPVRVERGAPTLAPEPRDLAVERRVKVRDRGQVIGTVVVTVPVDEALLRRARPRAGLKREDLLVAVRGDKIVLGGPGLVNRPLTVPAGDASKREVADAPYRVLRTAVLPEPAGLSFAVLAPQTQIDAATDSLKRRLLIGLLGLLVVIGFCAYLMSRSIVRMLGRFADAAYSIARGRLSERVPVRGRDEFAQLGRAFNEMAKQLESRLVELEAERVRLREATGRFGQALAATHDVDQLLMVVVETAVEATGAHGGAVLGPNGELVRAGNPDIGTQRIRLPLVVRKESFGLLVLSGASFDDEQRDTAAMLAGQAVVALENVLLHRAVERQASLDGLTGLANRRAAQEALHAELSRAARFGGDLALVIADLDGFKGVNDQFGHPVGDAVLREFAETLRATVREVDVAGRWGGEEFAVVLPGTDSGGGAQLAERVRSAFEQRPVLSPDGTPIPVTASFGVAAYPAHAGEEALVAAADAALYEAKRAGKNRVVTATGPVSPAQ